jgi:hypothetical protein
MIEARVVSSIHEVGRDRWSACARGRIEDFDYLAAVEACGIPGFAWRYALVEDGDRLIAAAPAFLTDYALETTLNPSGRRLAAAARRVAPRAFTVRLASLGSPCTEDAGVVFADALPAPQWQILQRLIAAFEACAAAEGCWLLGAKDVLADERPCWDEAAGGRYALTDGLPVAELDIAWPDLDGYLASLSRATRKDLRRKLRTASGVRIEVTHSLAGLEARVAELYRQTRARSDLQFEDLPAAYFTGVLAAMPGRAFCVLYWLEDELIGFNLLLQEAGVLLDKFFCMETARGPAHDLYFISWMTNVRLCLERGLALYRSGQAGYETKLRLGSRLAATDMYFRHRRPLVNRALKWAAPLLSDDAPAARRAA